METNTSSKGATITGWILTALSVLFFLVDGIMKIVKAAPSVEGSATLGWPVELVPAIGYLLTVFTVLYAIPRMRYWDAFSLPRTWVVLWRL